MRGLRIAGLCALALCGPSWSESATAQAGAPPLLDWFVCKPKQVIETLGRQIHVECQNSLMLSFDGSARTISFIAILASDPAADRFQALATAAVVSDKPFLAYVTGDPATNVAGCGEQDCRTPIYYGLGSAF